MVDHFPDDSYFQALPPVEPEVRILSIRNLEAPSYPALSQPTRLDVYFEESQMTPHVPEPIKLKGVGGTTLFGLSSRFEDGFPPSLTGKVAVEEFQLTLNRINAILHKSVPFNLKCLLCGALCCCCTFGLSLGPVFYLNKRTRSRIEKLLECENWRLYNKLGLNLRLYREQCETTSLREHVLLIEILPKIQMFKPD